MSTAWQTFTALCLLINVSFMATTSAEQDEYTANLINVQNDVFFGLLCFEAFLNLVSQGLALFLLTPSNQFDVFLIITTAVTM